MVEKCSIQNCNEIGVQKFDLYYDRPHFMKMIFCKKHTAEAKKQLEKDGIIVQKDGTYKKEQ